MWQLYLSTINKMSWGLARIKKNFSRSCWICCNSFQFKFSNFISSKSNWNRCSIRTLVTVANMLLARIMSQDGDSVFNSGMKYITSASFIALVTLPSSKGGGLASLITWTRNI